MTTEITESLFNKKQILYRIFPGRVCSKQGASVVSECPHPDTLSGSERSLIGYDAARAGKEDMARTATALASIVPWLLAASLCRAGWPDGPVISVDHAAWRDALLELRSTNLDALAAGVAGPAWLDLESRFPVPCDWALADSGPGFPREFAGPRPAAILRGMATRAAGEAAEGDEALREDLARSLVVAGEDLRALLDVSIRSCEARRARRLAAVLARAPRIVFAKHENLGGSHYAYTEAQSDAQDERHFLAGSSLCLLDVASGAVRTLVDSPDGMIRDPDVDFDGRRVLFSWKRSDRLDDFHLHELDIETGAVRQVAGGLGFADYEGIYLPGGDILFNSTRPVQTVDCWWTEVSNLYRCRRDGSGLRRLAFDQVHDNFPTLLEDGRAIYTRWEYNDRGQIYVQALFAMNLDGTGQTAFYGNNSWFPTAILHARGIPGTPQVVAVLSGHHTIQVGKLAVIDAGRGTEENLGVKLIAPERETRAVRIDTYGQDGELFAYPYPLSEDEFLVAHAPLGRSRPPLRLALYFMTRDGRRELLASDPSISSSQPIPLVPRPRPHLRPDLASGARNPEKAAFFLRDIHAGPGLEGLPRGTVKRLRVVALRFRAAGVRKNYSQGPAGAALSSTPVSVGNGAWDVKAVLGEATVREDGSACFAVPARTPVYFQALDERGCAVQSMRSWATLQPGETASCVGCHEPKSYAPPAGPPPLALRGTPEELRPPPGGVRGFSFPADVQPILDRHCVSCHRRRGPAARIASEEAPAVLSAFGEEWLHSFEDPGPSWEKPDFDARGWRKGRAGFGSPGTPGGKIGTTWNSGGIWLRREFDLPGGLVDLDVALRCAHDEDVEVYVNGVLAFSEPGFLIDPKTAPLPPAAALTLRPGRNLLAARCSQTGGGQFIDLGLVGTPRPRSDPLEAFSLLRIPVVEAISGRAWSESYIALTAAAPLTLGDREPVFRGDPDGPYVKWWGAQSAPPVVRPATTGSFRSPLVRMLELGHRGTALSREEMRTIACWIDLGVPFCGDYEEANAWSAGEWMLYRNFLAKRRAMDEIERRGGGVGPKRAP
jgi:hypothetical protein